jgi:hypothetical protein
MDAGAVTAPEQSRAPASRVLVAVLPHPGLLPEIAAYYDARVMKRQDRMIAGFTAGLHSRELDIFFSTLPSVADASKTWRGGADAGKPKLPPTATG